MCLRNLVSCTWLIGLEKVENIIKDVVLNHCMNTGTITGPYDFCIINIGINIRQVKLPQASSQ